MDDCYNSDITERAVITPNDENERARNVSLYIQGMGRLHPGLLEVFVPANVVGGKAQQVFLDRAVSALTTLARRYVRPHYLHFYAAPLGYDGREFAVVAAGWVRMTPLPIEVPADWGDRAFPHWMGMTWDGLNVVNGLWAAMGLGTITEERERYLRQQW